MRELNDTEQGLISGGSGASGDGGFGYGQVPGFDLEGPRGPNYTHSFGNGWSLTFGSTTDRSAQGIGVRYVWK
ncbi:hypothetical protein EQ718_16735 (plasmid) [Paracoccus versutus]|uniref:Uncharacterized protein n=1 Tax=Paracoccus versutus TaxID=34007 RepID=A0AAQ0KKU0_PARVE|nr:MULTISPECIES: hypothetical protein [Paracoccus]WGR61856.1 hypothetical protein E3U26_13875 [Paracoccus ferrooxidans]SFX69011.1 hypothetical protein SAMN04244548_01696 [Paracoccus pantotrophus]MBT0782737.1 hypothetical protein [Paracoccus sp. pheM1]MCJ1899982.1 hypothetical protein [Paracoccus versutus]MDF3904410.1 hypothetical protein [Paracoccus sp. AS002]